MQAPRQLGLLAIALFAAVCLGGCGAKSDCSKTSPPSVDCSEMIRGALVSRCEVRVTRLASGEAIALDGKLDEPVWQRAKTHSLRPGKAEARNLPWDLDEPGYAKIAYDDDFLYLAFDMEDSDLVAEGTRDNEHHYQKGDVVEVFIKPAGQTYYWELYLTPKQHRTLFFIPGAGRIGVPSTFAKAQAIPDSYRTGVSLEGSLNNWSDRDTRWVAELAIPLSLVESRGQKFGPDGDDWEMLMARYNFSVYRQHPGGLVTTFPQLPVRNFHLPREFGWVYFGE